MWAAVTLLFLDFTGTSARWLGWTAKIQFVPALLAHSALILFGLVVLTLLFGRIYCSVICPLGVMQDGFAWLGKRFKRNRYSYSPAMTKLRIAALVFFVIALVANLSWLAALIAPYSTYGRIITSLVMPASDALNNLGADWSAAKGNYIFLPVERGPRLLLITLSSAIALLLIATLAWLNGRSWCNTICPVGTILGLMSRYSLFRPVIDTSKCNGCGLCARNCKSACIDPKTHTIDLSRCVDCMDCIGKCSKGAISYTSLRYQPQAAEEGMSRRKFMTVAALGTAAAASQMKAKTVDGGLAAITAKEAPKRKVALVPAGAVSPRHLTEHCIACQLCVTACPNKVLRPSPDFDTLMQPVMSYELGHCRPECTACGDVCPAGAIRPVSIEEKSSISIGHAVVVMNNCVSLTDGQECGNCARHCPTGAITMVSSDPLDDTSAKVPVVNEARCIGCGACEHLCPSRPFSAIYVEGRDSHSLLI